MVREITIVAEVKRPETTARDEATTAMEGGETVSMVALNKERTGRVLFSYLSWVTGTGDKGGVTGFTPQIMI